MLAVHRLVLCILVLAAVATAQQPNSADARLLLNGMGTNGPWPVAAWLAHTGALGTVQLTSAAATTPVPFALAFGHLAAGHMSFGAQSLDLDTSACGFSVVMNGFDPGHPFQSWSWLATQFQVTVWFPNAFGGPAAMQACVAVPTAPQGFVLTAAADLFNGGPVLGAVGPNAGTAGGGMQVVLSGTNFQCDPATVLFGTTPATNVQVLSPCFDYLGSGAGAGALIIEQIAAPNAVTALNLNRLHAANFTPLRRIIAGPANNIAAFGGLEVYHQRFTFVGLEASARSVFKDCGVPAIQSAQYLACVVTPPLASQPACSATKLEFEGATAIVGPNQALGATTGWMTYAQGNALAVSIDPLVLSNPVISAPQLSGRRFYRFRCTLRANNLTNQVPSIDRIDMLASW